MVSLLEVAALLVAVVLGSMVFFSFVMAPLIFIKLPAETSGPFIRQVFPVYYLALAILCGLAGALLLSSDRLAGVSMLAVSLAFVLARQALMPAINRLRDAQLRGEPGAEKNAFGLLHRASVVLNYIQLVVVVVVFLRTAGA